MEKTVVHCTINGQKVEAYVDVRASLTDLLRGEFHLHSVKEGCQVGECGACTVIIDGETFNACIYLAIWAEGKHIRTLEGLETLDGSLTPLQQAFIDEGAIQCGFCTPGFVMSGTALLEQGQPLSREEIKRGISGNFCRCTGYENIVNAIEKVIGHNQP